MPSENKSQQTLLERFTPLHLKADTAKGRAVFAGRNIPSGTIIDTCAVLVLGLEECRDHIRNTSLYHYTYNWPITIDINGVSKPTVTQALVFGLGSMFNHSTQDQNVGWKRDLENRLVVYRALRDIAEGEELCISYGDHLTFEDADKADDANGMEEDEDELLENIQLET